MDGSDSTAGFDDDLLADPTGGGSGSSFHAPDLDPRLPKDVHEAMNRLRGRPTERAWFFNATGKPFYLDSKPDRGFEVVMTEAQMDAQSRGKNAHNHLSESFFSPQDLRNAIRTDRAETWVVTPGNTRFVLFLSEGHGITEDEMEQIGREAFLAGFDRFYKGETQLYAEANEFAKAIRKFEGRARLEYNGSDERDR